MTEQQREQMADLDWARTVLSGKGLSIDSQDSAAAVLTALLEFGASETIRRSADELLRSIPSTPQLVAA